MLLRLLITSSVQATINGIMLLSGALHLTCCTVDNVNAPVGKLWERISYSITPKLKVYG